MIKVLRVINRIVGYAGGVSCGLIIVISILLLYEVFMRYVINKPADWVLDVTQLTQATLAFVSISYVLKVHGHTNMNLLTEFVGNRGRRWLSIFSNLVTLVASFWMTFLSWNLFAKSYRIKEAAYGVDIPLYPFKIFVTIGFALMGIQCLAMIIEDIQSSPDRFSATHTEH